MHSNTYKNTKFFGGSATTCASPPPWPSIFSIIHFGSTALLTRMTGISLHMQWPLTSHKNTKFIRNFTDTILIFSILFRLTDQNARKDEVGEVIQRPSSYLDGEGHILKKSFGRQSYTTATEL
jgi:hypothetical protein